MTFTVGFWWCKSNFVFLVNSFVSLSKELFEEGVPYILSEKLSQDPLEEHFATHRRIAGSNEHVKYAVIQQQEVSVNVMKSDLISDLRGNTSGRPDARAPIDVNDVRLPKKRAHKR